MENALRANPLDVRRQYEKQRRDLQEAYGEAMLELRAGKKLQTLLGEPLERHWSKRQWRTVTAIDPQRPARPSR